VLAQPGKHKHYERFIWKSYYFAIIYRMNDMPCTYRISVKGIIKNSEGRILLLREKDGSWDLPGGGLEHGEDPIQTLTREITEETRMKVVRINENPVAFWSININKKVGSPILKWFAFVLYEARVSGEFIPNLDSEESQEGKYFSIDEAKQLQLHDNVKPYFI
jgi:8-oxo-dGTP diphosphatase